MFIASSKQKLFSNSYSLSLVGPRNTGNNTDSGFEDEVHSSPSSPIQQSQPMKIAALKLKKQISLNEDSSPKKQALNYSRKPCLPAFLTIDDMTSKKDRYIFLGNYALTYDGVYIKFIYFDCFLRI